MGRTAHRRAAGRAAPTPPPRPLSGRRLPVPSRRSCLLLAMPATSDSVERLFSVAGQVVTAKRARLDPSTVALLVFLHEAIPGGIERESYEIIESALEIENDKYLDTGDQ